ncbi:MAG TPA: glycoside hydrolase family 3 protein, partial [Lacipirellulaceae bacterium]|nr:glycoside hydrolase family 3 protein [Lacipirellulaceae bacterium]
MRSVHRRSWSGLTAAAVAMWMLASASAGCAADAGGVAVAPAARSLASYDDVVDRVLARMTLAEKIGQMTQAELSSLGDLSPIRELALGSVLCGGNSDPADGNSVEAWADAYDACQREALQSRLGIPLLFGIDAMHGHSNVLGAVIFPHNIGLGCTRDAELVEEIGRVTALEVRATGINWTFAPCVTVPRDDRWGRTYEGFGEEPQLSGELGAALVRGLQAGDLSHPLSVLGCAKHFVGDGATRAEMRDKTNFSDEPQLSLDQGDAVIDEQELREIHLAPYPPSLAEGVGSVMVSYSSWNGLKCTAHPWLLTDVLKGELGFDGLVISDYKAIGQTDPDFRTAIAKSINAGIDMAMEPSDYREFIEHLTALVEDGEVPLERIDDAVRRILRVKAAMGLLGDDPLTQTDRSLQDEFGSAERRELARRAVRQSLVLLKNDGVLPLSTDGGRIHVAGVGADDIGIQCGG